ncbi:IS200/IS605 family transposase [Candidatus Woesearchaeota archaeon]|nr:IS200/IS605 family transposase [Candidatus Woesearchaeota archaeon]
MQQTSFNSFSYKKHSEDTRNNWVTMMFVTKKRYNCFRKQSVINTCTDAFKEFEAFGFEFGEIGFGGTHVHMSVNVPKKYSIQVAEIMLKSRSSKRIFEKHPGFRKRYPKGSFWSGYEYHESIGKNREEAEAYIRNQPIHHNVKVIDDVQKTLATFTAS